MSLLSLPWIVSDAVLAEYREVLARPRLAIDKSKAETALASIRDASILVTAKNVVYASTDPDDNRFLECAQAGDADYLVTGNLKHFPQQWGTTPIVSPRQFIDICTALIS